MPSKCERCDATLAPNALDGLCPFCITQGLFGAFDEADESSGKLGSIGKYQLLEEIGEGGFAIVYRAEETGTVRREVALKVIKKGMDTRQVIARFEAERQAVAMMDHPDIATVFDAGTTDDGRPFFAMELVEGETITEFAREQDLQSRLKLMVRVCDAVEHAHRRGIIHRDLKPNNILVSTAAAQLKVIDFGIAKATEHLLTESTLVTGGGQLLGTPGYMSPEQATLGKADVDTRTDVYALGVLLYEILAQRPVWSRETLGAMPVDEMLRTVREDEVPPPSKQTPELPSDLDWVTARATAKERDRRYGSAAELGADLQRYLDGEAIQARPPSTSYRLKKFIARHRVPVIASTLVALAIVGGLVASTLFAINAERRRAETAAAKDETRRNFAAADLGMAREAAADGRHADGIAYLCRALRTDPENHSAAQLLAHTLVYQGFPQPSADPQNINYAARQILTLAENRLLVLGSQGRPAIWKVTDGNFTKTETKLPRNADRAYARPNSHHFALHTQDSWSIFDLQGNALAKNIAPGVSRVSLSPDATTLAAITSNQVTGFNTSSGEQLWLWSGEQKITTHAVTPERDYLALGQATGEVTILNHLTGKELTRFTLPEKNAIAHISLARSWLAATTSGSKQIHRYRLGRKKPPATLTLTEPATELVMDRSGEQLAATTNNHLYLFPETSKPTIIEQPCSQLKFSPDSTILAARTTPHNITTYRFPTGRSRGIPMQHARTLADFHFLENRIAAVTESGTMHLWSTHGSRPDLLNIVHGDTPHLAVGFSQHGENITILNYDSRVGLYSPDNGFDHIAFVPPLPDPKPFPLAMTSENRILFIHKRLGIDENTIDAEVTLSVFDGNNIPLQGARVHHKGVRYGQITKLGELAVIGGLDGSVTLYAMDVGNQLHRWELQDQPVTLIAMSPDDRFAVACGSDQAFILNLTPPFNSIAVAHDAPVHSIAISPNGRLLATGSEDNTARLWKLPSGEPHSPPLRHEEIAAEDGVIVAFSPDGRHLITGGSGDFTARLWDTTTGTQTIDPLRHDGVVRSFAWSPDPEVIATGCDDGFTRIWNAQRGGLVAPPLKHPGPSRSKKTSGSTHDKPIAFIHFDPLSGRRLVSAASFGGCEVYELAQPDLKLEPWFLDFAEALAGIRFNQRAMLEAVPAKELFDWQKKLANLPPETGSTCEQTAAWLIADENTRPRTPFAPWRESGPAEKFRPERPPFGNGQKEGVTGFNGE